MAVMRQPVILTILASYRFTTTIVVSLTNAGMFHLAGTRTNTKVGERDDFAWWADDNGLQLLRWTLLVS